MLWLNVPVNNFSVMWGCDYFFLCVNQYNEELKVYCLRAIHGEDQLLKAEYSDNPNITCISFVHLVAH